MKPLILSIGLLLASLSAFGQNPACNSPQGAIQNNVSVSTNSATTLNKFINQVNIHVCSITISLPEANTVTFQASDGTVISGPNVGIGTYTLNWNGQLSTVGGGAALGSNFQIKLTNAPSVAFGVTLIYYTSQ